MCSGVGWRGAYNLICSYLLGVFILTINIVYVVQWKTTSTIRILHPHLNRHSRCPHHPILCLCRHTLLQTHGRAAEGSTITNWNNDNNAYCDKPALWSYVPDSINARYTIHARFFYLMWNVDELFGSLRFVLREIWNVLSPLRLSPWFGFGSQRRTSASNTKCQKLIRRQAQLDILSGKALGMYIAKCNRQSVIVSKWYTSSREYVKRILMNFSRKT